MTAFRTSVVLAALLAFAGVAAGADPAQGPATTAPTPIVNGPTPLDPPSPTDFKPGQPAASTVTTGDLGILDGPAVGTLDDSNGGLGKSLWINARRDEIEDLLGRVPLVSADPFVRALARRVVLTTSDTPPGPAKRALIAIRIEKLLQAGLIEDAATLAAAVRLDNDPDFARVQADALLYAGRDKDVCGDLTATRLASPDPFWLQLRTWCFAAGGDAASAELTRAVLSAQGAGDPAFDLLAADVLTGKKKAPATIDHPTALHIYLLRKAGIAVTGATAAKLGTAANVLAARETRDTPADRLAAAARISATGALTTAELLAILNIQTIPADQLAQARAATAKLVFLPAQALLRRAALLETRPGPRTDLLIAALSADGHPDRLALTAALQENLALALKPDATTAKGRFLVSRALVLRGKADAAAAWYGAASDDADAHVFQVLIDLAAPTPARDAAAQSAFAWFAHAAAPQQNPSAASALALGLADVLGKSMPPQAKALAGTLEGMRWTGTRPAPEDLRKLADAASQPGRKGEAILRVLDIVGPAGPADAAPDIVIECVRVLEQLGMADEARALAVEALATARTP